jgi:hypothetical protein
MCCTQLALNYSGVGNEAYWVLNGTGQASKQRRQLAVEGTELSRYLRCEIVLT